MVTEDSFDIDNFIQSYLYYYDNQLFENSEMIDILSPFSYLKKVGYDKENGLLEMSINISYPIRYNRIYKYKIRYHNDYILYQSKDKEIIIKDRIYAFLKEALDSLILNLKYNKEEKYMKKEILEIHKDECVIEYVKSQFPKLIHLNGDELKLSCIITKHYQNQNINEIKVSYYDKIKLDVSNSIHLENFYYKTDTNEPEKYINLLEIWIDEQLKQIDSLYKDKNVKAEEVTEKKINILETPQQPQPPILLELFDCINNFEYLVNVELGKIHNKLVSAKYNESDLIKAKEYEKTGIFPELTNYLLRLNDINNMYISFLRNLSTTLGTKYNILFDGYENPYNKNIPNIIDANILYRYFIYEVNMTVTLNHLFYFLFKMNISNSNKYQFNSIFKDDIINGVSKEHIDVQDFDDYLIELFNVNENIINVHDLTKLKSEPIVATDLVSTVNYINTNVKINYNNLAELINSVNDELSKL